MGRASSLVSLPVVNGGYSVARPSSRYGIALYSLSPDLQDGSDRGHWVPFAPPRHHVFLKICERFAAVEFTQMLVEPGRVGPPHSFDMMFNRDVRHAPLDSYLVTG